MKQRLADYVADFLTSHGIKECFTVVGGGAMHLNDAFGHHKKLHCTYNHHEQASAIAAEAYARVHEEMALLCVTTGPGGTNAITGVVGAWLDSIPMFVVSGQVRYDTTARFASRYTEGLPLRAVGDQEFDITKSVGCMCKYAQMLEDPKDIKKMLERAWRAATGGRKGPVWLDIPVNYQGMIIETEDLESDEACVTDEHKPLEKDIKTILDKIRLAKRPVLYAGQGIRLSGGYKEFRKTVECLGIPVVTCWDSIDLIENEHPLYTGRGGNMGDRAGNFAVQNADFILAVGNRLSIRQVGYGWDTWAREAFVAMVDIDPAELKKPTIHVELPICADAKDFFKALLKAVQNEKISEPVFREDSWIEICQNWKRDYPVTTKKHWEEDGSYANVYAFVNHLSSHLPEGNLTVVSNGAACVVGSHNYVIQKDARFIINSAIASMGYGLPAAIGACIGADKKTTICIEGDGSLMMNLQELQTILTNQLPIKIFLINNQGYHSIRQTQNNLFSDRCKVGIGPESQDLSFPSYERIAKAFGYPYYSASSNTEMKAVIDTVLKEDGPLFCEIFVSVDQNFEPKSATKRLEDGILVSPPLEDLAPFLDREEFEKNMYIPIL